VIAVTSRRPAIHLAGRLMLGALLGKLLGFAREIVMARLLGANVVADSFRAGTTATLMPIAAMQGDIVPSALIPLHRHWRGEGTAPLRFALLATMFGLVTLPIVLIVWVLAGPWVGFLVPGFGPQAHAMTVAFVRVMSLAMPASVLANCFSCIEISVGRSRVAMMRASVQNLAVIGAIGLMAVTGNPLLIAWAFALSMTATALFGLVLLVREGELTLHGATLAEAWFVGATFLRRARVLFVQPLAEQGNILLERSLASAVGVGALASIDYARTLTETALFLISQPIGYVVLAQQTGDRGQTRRQVEALLRPLLALALPASVFIVVFASDIVTVVLRRGAFGAHAVELTSAALRGIGVGLWATTIGWVLIRMINAAGRNRAAVAVLTGAYAANALANIALVPRLGVFGVGLGETARGLTLLIGAACVLHCGALLLRRLLAMALPVAGFVLVAIPIGHTAFHPAMRLLLAGAAFGPGAALCLLVSSPQLTQRLLTKLRPRRLARGA
jgi:putative peptidoglycan lipid II flippase